MQPYGEAGVGSRTTVYEPIWEGKRLDPRFLVALARDARPGRFRTNLAVRISLSETSESCLLGYTYPAYGLSAERARPGSQQGQGVCRAEGPSWRRPFCLRASAVGRFRPPARLVGDEGLASPPRLLALHPLDSLRHLEAAANLVEWVAELIGTVPAWQTKIRTDRYGFASSEGTRTRGFRFEVNPSQLQRLGSGEA